MTKTIIKEVFVILLTTIAIGLILAVIFYQYLPTNRVIPSKVSAYSTPENVEKEIKDDSYNGELQEKVQSYTITDADLSRYKASQSYNPGKPDPFRTYSEGTTGGDNETGNNTGTTTKPPVDANTSDNYYTAANITHGTK